MRVVVSVPKHPWHTAVVARQLLQFYTIARKVHREPVTNVLLDLEYSNLADMQAAR